MNTFNNGYNFINKKDSFGNKRNFKSYHSKNNYIIPQAPIFDKSFDYSNYLLDNLKYKISNIEFH